MISGSTRSKQLSRVGASHLRRANQRTYEYVPGRRQRPTEIIYKSGKSAFLNGCYFHDDSNPAMKLIITGATGFVASEVLRQALLLPSITSIVAVARSPISAPEGTPNSSKLRSIVVPDYGTWSEDVKKEIAGADACIWYECSSNCLLYR
jgi:hypothetical protein